LKCADAKRFHLKVWNGRCLELSSRLEIYKSAGLGNRENLSPQRGLGGGRKEETEGKIPELWFIVSVPEKGSTKYLDGEQATSNHDNKTVEQ
jgi:hypothetical protein